MTTKRLSTDSGSREAGAALALFDTAREALAHAVKIDEVQDVRDQAERMKLYARQARDKSLIADAVELQHRAERRLGEMIIAAKASGEISRGGRPRETPSQEEGVFDKATLADAGITYKLSMKAQELAAVPAEQFESVIAKARDKILSTGAVVVNPAKDLGGADKKQRRAVREAELAARQAALPDRRYGVILADPEWRFEPYSRDSGMDRAADNHYPTSSLEAIKARPVADIAADDCVLFLWATVPMLPQALEVMAAWGFDYKSHTIWRKAAPHPAAAQPPSPGAGEGKLVLGTGYWFRNAHELLLVGTRGAVPAPAMGTQHASMFDAPPLRHSQKPVEAYELIESYFPTLPKIELNAREARSGWDSWGNEAPNTSERATEMDRARDSDRARENSGSGKGPEGDPAQADAGTLSHPEEVESTLAGEEGSAARLPGSKFAAGPEGDPRAEYRARVAASGVRPGGYSRETAAPILRAAYATDPVVPTKQIAADLGHPIGTILTWASREGLTKAERRGGPDRLGQTKAGAEV